MVLSYIIKTCNEFELFIRLSEKLEDNTESFDKILLEERISECYKILESKLKWYTLILLVNFLPPKFRTYCYEI